MFVSKSLNKKNCHGNFYPILSYPILSGIMTGLQHFKIRIYNPLQTHYTSLRKEGTGSWEGWKLGKAHAFHVVASHKALRWNKIERAKQSVQFTRLLSG